MQGHNTFKYLIREDSIPRTPQKASNHSELSTTGSKYGFEGRKWSTDESLSQRQKLISTIDLKRSQIMLAKKKVEHVQQQLIKIELEDEKYIQYYEQMAKLAKHIIEEQLEIIKLDRKVKLQERTIDKSKDKTDYKKLDQKKYSQSSKTSHNQKYQVKSIKEHEIMDRKLGKNIHQQKIKPIERHIKYESNFILPFELTMNESNTSISKDTSESSFTTQWRKQLQNDLSCLKELDVLLQEKQSELKMSKKSSNTSRVRTHKRSLTSKATFFE